MRRIFLMTAVLLVGLAIGGYVFFNGERKAPVRYRTAMIERGPVISVVTATGSINPVVSVQVGTQVSGMIKSLHADFNSIVKAGDIVATNRADDNPNIHFEKNILFASAIHSLEKTSHATLLSWSSKTFIAEQNERGETLISSPRSFLPPPGHP